MIELIRTLVLAALGIALAIVSTFGLTYNDVSAPTDPVPARIETVEEVATTTPPVVATLPATTTPEKPKPVPKPTPTPTPTPSPITEVIETIATPIPSVEPTPVTLNDRVRAAVVNIICVSETGGPLNSISASGVVIDPRGVIMTNSHVAQYFLLKNYPQQNFVSCTVRTGSPAQSKYTAELVFLPPSWIQKNAHKINDENPTGNGEHDYALIRVTGTVSDQVAMPTSFNYLEISTATVTQGQNALIAGYPAGFLGGITVAKDLHQASSITPIRELYTFGTVSADLFSIGGSIVAQQGSSGGAAVNDAGHLIGLIVTSTDAPDTASRDLRALATSYIVADFEKESGKPLSAYLTGDAANLARQFLIGIAPTLSQTLINELAR